MRPELPDYGIFSRWPTEGSAWIHPDDRAIVMGFLPCDRILRRERFDGSFYHYRYGAIRFRLKPSMWIPIRGEGIDIGDLVEVIGLGMERELFIATVVDAIFVPRESRSVYRLSRAGSIIDRLYGCDELQVLTNKTKLRRGETVHPAPRWVEEFREEAISGERLHLSSDIEADDRSDQ